MSIVDAFELDPENGFARDADVCVIGSGPAGLTVALDLARHTRNRIVVLEAGGRQRSEASQSLYRGENAGDRYYELNECRLRCFGGTSNHWSGWCRELDAHDFRAKAHVPFSGWPITRRDLEPHRKASYEILNVYSPFTDRAIPHAGHEVLDAKWVFTDPVRFAAKYGVSIEKSDSLDLVLNACVVDFDIGGEGERVDAVRFKTSNPESPVFRLRAGMFVLACGGIENARVLLNARRVWKNGIGNQHDLVGRFFMEHPHYEIGQYADFTGKFGRHEDILKVTEEFVHEQRTLNCAFRFVPFDSNILHSEKLQDVIDTFCRAAPDLADGVLSTLGTNSCFGTLRVMSEQAPNPDSRVTLSDRVDKLGMRIVRLEWRKQAVDKHTIRKAAFAIGRAFVASGLGRIRLNEWVQGGALDHEHDWMMGGWHHMGTTRMATTPRLGVVDRDCRVFGINNLFVAGSSVFNTSGCANPTLTIVQLALRLAGHLRERLGYP